MKKIFLPLLLIALLSASCSKKKSDKHESGEITDTEFSNPVVPETDSGTSAPPPPTSTVPAQALSFSTSGVKLVNFTSGQATKYRKAMEIVRLVVGTAEFRRKVLNYYYNGKKAFVDNGGHTNSQVYQTILDGAEKLFPSKNNTMDVEVEMYYSDNSTVGYTYPSSKRIWVNSKFFNNYTAAQVANNLMHEWLHKLGYGHASTWSASRDHSVPYAVGRIVGSIGRNFL